MKSSWIGQRRTQLKMSQDELAARLNADGFKVARSTISNWENEKFSPPVDNENFRISLANALRMSVRDVLHKSGYDNSEVDYNRLAMRAAEIVNQLPENKQKLAVGILEQFLSEII